MKKKYKDSVEYKALLRIKKIRSNVILRKELGDLGSYRQVSRALNKLIALRKIVKIGAGVYAKLHISMHSNIFMIQGGYRDACRVALNKLGVSWELDSAQKAYNAGLTTQIPMWNAVRLKSRFRGKIGYGNKKLIMENKINAK